MRAFMDKEFLLENEIARTLFHKYAENQPIYDYHNHLPPREIAERKQYENLTQLWLAADHYKWRAMRWNGVPEEFCTGNASPWEKFLAFARTVPRTVRTGLSPPFCISALRRRPTCTSIVRLST